MPMPNFLIVGAIKGGTTSLYEYVGQHPDVFMCPVKEPRYFALACGDAGVPQSGITDRAHYESLFDGVTTERAIGEASPQYLWSTVAPGCIHSHVPDARLIAVLRNPVDRAYSAYLHLARIGEAPADFADALTQEDAHVRAGRAPLFRYREAGRYAEQLERYFALFDREQIAVHLYEDLSRDPASVVAATFRFLDVDDGFAPDTSLRYNPSGIPRLRTVQRVMASTRAEKALPPKVLSRARLRVAKWNLVKPPLEPRVRAMLVDEFRDDIDCLARLIDRDLSTWLAT